MVIIPAVDIKGGKCVRLEQGRMDAETVFADDPAVMAQKWDKAGAEIIHIIDLDGAVMKRPQNLAVIKKIVASVAARIQIGGGIRTRETIEEQIAVKLKELVIPYLDLLRQSAVNEKQAETINIIAAHIDSITHTFSPKVREIVLGLSPRETMIADLVWQGKTSKDIAEILNISLRTVETYRNNLRKKLGINKKKISLRTYLMNHFTQ